MGDIRDQRSRERDGSSLARRQTMVKKGEEQGQGIEKADEKRLATWHGLS